MRLFWGLGHVHKKGLEGPLFIITNPEGLLLEFSNYTYVLLWKNKHFINYHNNEV